MVRDGAHQLRARRFECRRVVGRGDAGSGGSEIGGGHARRGRNYLYGASESALGARPPRRTRLQPSSSYSTPLGVRRLYSPAIQRGISTLYHCEKRFSLGPPGRFVQASSAPMSVTKWYVGAKVVSRVAVVIKWPWKGVAWQPGMAIARERKPSRRPPRALPKKRFTKWKELNSDQDSTGSSWASSAARCTSACLLRPRHQDDVTLRSVRSIAVSTIVE